ncbi:hypothetical protein C8R44DRAFT_788656 [Mycena epipterygia]|nr:hypothetical protein C8R44DRAFT_788656 [Mycena epipterygia]
MTFFGPACQTLCDIAVKEYPGSIATRGTVFEYSAPEILGGSKLRVKITARGDYDLTRGGNGDTEDRPDALIAENAGLFIYTTWQIVYSNAARRGIPWGVTEYHMEEAIEYEGHMWQWRDLTIQGCHLSAQRGLCSQETAQENIARASRVKASGAGMNPFMRPGLMKSQSAVPRAYNGFVLRVC